MRKHDWLPGAGVISVRQQCVSKGDGEALISGSDWREGGNTVSNCGAWHIRKTNFASARVGILGIGVILLTIGPESAASGSWEIFQRHLSSVPPAFEVEYEEGDLDSTEVPRAEALPAQGRQIYVVKQPRQRFLARCQVAGFSMEQVMPTLSTRGNDGKLVHLSGVRRLGYYDDLAWSSSNTNTIWLIHVAADGSDHTNAIWTRIRLEEQRAWEVYFFGLPWLDPATVRWEGTTLLGWMHDGGSVEAEAVIDPNSHQVREIHYRCRDANGRENRAGRVRYRYESDSGVFPLPSVFEHQSLRAADPYEAARANRRVRIVRLASFATVRPASAYLPPGGLNSPEVRGLFSNGVFFAKSRTGEFIPATTNIFRDVSPAGASRIGRNLIFAAMLTTSVVAILVLAMWRMKQTHPPTQ